jgi:phosphatidyl-myo-inositol dimannoside synthase
VRRILLILTEFPPRVGGMQTHAAYLSRHLAQLGYQLDVFTHRLSDPSLAQDAVSYDEAQPFAIHRVLGRLSYQHNLQLVAVYARRTQPDLIYSSTVFYGALGKLLGIPVVCRSVGNDVLRPWFGYPYRVGSRLLNSPRLEKLLHAWLERELYPDWVETLFRRKRAELTADGAQAASLILANSDFTSTLLGQLGVRTTRVRTLVGGVESKRFAHQTDSRKALRRKLGLPETGFLLMTACRLVAKKGIDVLLAAASLLRTKIPGVHLVVVGDGKYRFRYERHCAEHAIDNVHFAGRISHERIHDFYAACDIFVLASRDSVNPLTGSRDVETMGRVLCEANAAGIPVIASRCGGIPSVIANEENGLLFEPGDIGQLLEQICRLHADPQLRTELSKRGVARSREQFDWSAILLAHLEVFDEVVRENTTVHVAAPSKSLTAATN